MGSIDNFDFPEDTEVPFYVITMLCNQYIDHINTIEETEIMRFINSLEAMIMKYEIQKEYQHSEILKEYHIRIMELSLKRISDEMMVHN